MKLTQFNGGLNIRQAPHLIELNEGVIYNNIDNSVGHFKPVKDKKDLTETEFSNLTDIKDYGFYFDIAGEGYFTDTPNDWVVFKEVLYKADRVGIPQKRVLPGVFQNLGIAPPAAPPTVTGIGNPISGEVTYAITFYNATDDSESVPAFAQPIAIHDGGADLSDIEVSTDPQVTHVRIYRVGGDIGVFTLVTSVVNGTTDFTDTIADINVDGRLMRSQSWNQAPAGLKYLTEAYAMLFGILGDKLYYTPIGLPNAWPTNNYIDLPNEGTGIAVTPIGLLVFTEHKTILVTGTGPSSLAQQTLSVDQGCTNHDSIASIHGTAIWLSHDGICVSNGGIPEVISKGKLGKWDLEITTAVAYNEAYYVQTKDGTTLIWNFAFGNVPMTRQYSGIVSLALFKNRLFGLGQEKVWGLGESDQYLPAHFKSGWLGAGGLIAEKVQDHYRVAFKGQITLRFKSNSQHSFEQSYNSPEFKVIKDKLPNSLTRNNYIEIEIEGTGELYELEIDEVTANG